MKGNFGFWPFISGTLWVTGLAIVLALPVSLLMSIFLTEYARQWVRRWVYPLLDILAGLPSVIYGVWGTLLIVPFVSDVLMERFSDGGSGFSVLAGGVVLGVMIIPLLVSLMVELFTGVGADLREASLALGATRWQTVKFALLRKTLPGLIAAVVLSISRAMGETIAVLMVCGNLAIVPHGLLEACYPIPALIANNYGEMMSMPQYEAALMFAALILFVVVAIFNLISRIVLRHINN